MFWTIPMVRFNKSAAGAAPPAAGGSIFITGRTRKRHMVKQGSNLQWMGSLLWMWFTASR